MKLIRSTFLVVLLQQEMHRLNDDIHSNVVGKNNIFLALEVIRADRVCTSFALYVGQRVGGSPSRCAFFRILHLKDPGMSESQGNHKGNRWNATRPTWAEQFELFR